MGKHITTEFDFFGVKIGDEVTTNSMRRRIGNFWAQFREKKKFIDSTVLVYSPMTIHNKTWGTCVVEITNNNRLRSVLLCDAALPFAQQGYFILNSEFRNQRKKFKSKWGKGEIVHFNPDKPLMGYSETWENADSGVTIITSEEYFNGKTEQPDRYPTRFGIIYYARTATQPRPDPNALIDFTRPYDPEWDMYYDENGEMRELDEEAKAEEEKTVDPVEERIRVFERGWERANRDFPLQNEELIAEMEKAKQDHIQKIREEEAAKKEALKQKLRSEIKDELRKELKEELREEILKELETKKKHR